MYQNISLYAFHTKWTLDNTEIKNGQSRETGNIGYTTRRKTKTQHNMCWIPQCAKKQIT